MQKTLLIADAGSTKTEWWFDGKTVTTQGINPVTMSEGEILDIMKSMKAAFPNDSVCAAAQIYFYGAGCTLAKAPVVREALGKVFPQAEDITVESDLLGAARALCGRQSGIACILGTGSNSCLYDGEKIIQNTPALGFILGDEGSGAVLGKLFLNALFKGRLDEVIANDFKAQHNLDIAEVINRVYRSAKPNSFLASLSPFIYKHKDNEAIITLIEQNFRDFFDRNISPYAEAKLLPINFVGSIAWHYQDILRAVAESEGYTFGKILQKPLEGMVHYHTTNAYVW